MQTRPFALSVAIYALNARQLASFYAKVLGLSVVDEGATFVLLGSAQLELAIVQIPEAIASALNIGHPPQPREETPIKLSFLVPDIELARPTVVSHGGALKDAASAWSWRGARHLDGHDPEGNVFQLRQLEDIA